MRDSGKKNKGIKRNQTLDRATQSLFSRPEKFSGVAAGPAPFPPPTFTSLDSLRGINQYGYRGRRNFDEEFRILIVDGAAGEALPYLAVQTARLPRVEIVCLDPHPEAQDRGRARLDRLAVHWGRPEIGKTVTFRRGSLSDVGSAAPGTFDYINCRDVLHRLDDPPSGLEALASALKEEGIMGISVPARIGQAPLLFIREMAKILHRTETAPDRANDTLKRILENLPDTNPLDPASRPIPAESALFAFPESDSGPDVQAFSLGRILEWIERSGLVFCRHSRRSIPYLDPRYFPGKLPRRIRSRLAEMKPDEIAAFAEHLAGNLDRHEFYVTKKSGTAADGTDGEMIPSFSPQAEAIRLKEALQSPRREPIRSITFPVEFHPGKIDVPVDVSPTALLSYPMIDDRRTMREIATLLRSCRPARAEESLRNELVERWRPLLDFEMLYFRHASGNLDNLRSTL